MKIKIILIKMVTYKIMIIFYRDFDVGKFFNVLVFQKCNIQITFFFTFFSEFDTYSAIILKLINTIVNSFQSLNIKSDIFFKLTFKPVILTI